MIDSERALAIARQRTEERGWAFSEPVVVVRRRSWFGRNDRFEIETNAGKRGTKARFVVSATTGEVTSEGYIPR